MVTQFDVVVVGAGIVGCACAARLAREGLSVCVVDPSPPGSGATAAGMGHLVVMDDSAAQLELTIASLRLWLDLLPTLPRSAETISPGTLWVAEYEAGMEAVESKRTLYANAGVAAQTWGPARVHEGEPVLRPVAGALHVPGDCVVYPPTIAAKLLADSRATLVQATATAINGDGCETSQGLLRTRWVVNCAGAHATDFAPLPIQPRKGHLAITERRPGFLRHQVVELGYLASAHGSDEASVAFNVQPRATGQVLIGSSREFAGWDPAIRRTMLAKMIARAVSFVPELATLHVVRSWVGFRAATNDHLPVIGPIPDQPSHIVAAGHEGLGITTSLATAELVAHHVCGVEPVISPEPYLPGRFAA